VNSTFIALCVSTVCSECSLKAYTVGREPSMRYIGASSSISMISFLNTVLQT